jgi:hypothetical protein
VMGEWRRCRRPYRAEARLPARPSRVQIEKARAIVSGEWYRDRVVSVAGVHDSGKWKSRCQVEEDVRTKDVVCASRTSRTSRTSRPQPIRYPDAASDKCLVSLARGILLIRDKYFWLPNFHVVDVERS